MTPAPETGFWDLKSAGSLPPLGAVGTTASVLVIGWGWGGGGCRGRGVFFHPSPDWGVWGVWGGWGGGGGGGGCLLGGHEVLRGPAALSIHGVRYIEGLPVICHERSPSRLRSRTPLEAIDSDADEDVPPPPAGDRSFLKPSRPQPRARSGRDLGEGIR